MDILNSLNLFLILLYVIYFYVMPFFIIIHFYLNFIYLDLIILHIFDHNDYDGDGHLHVNFYSLNFNYFLNLHVYDNVKYLLN